ncbi:MAG: hypothetical protein Q8R08_04740 [bacterium]|nr:hypothetical protein [bacterium]
MLTDQDITKLKEVFATRDEITANFVVVKSDIADIKKDVEGLRESIQALTITIDGLVKEIRLLREEYAAISNRIQRHETWIKQLAEKLGVNLGF